MGRNKNVSTILEWLSFSTSNTDIVNIVGPPGMGKSALAIYVVNEVITRGESVYYINMAEFPKEQLKQVLAAKIFSLWNRESNLTRISFDRLRHWANSLWLNTVIVLDNCDDCIQNQFEAFHDAIKELLAFSHGKIKIITTSREILMHLENYATFRVHPLDEESAISLLESKVPHGLNLTEKKAIATLTGEVPLALQIIGALLNAGINSPTPMEVITSLKKHPISTLSPSNIQRSMTLNGSISLSYNYLDKTTQRIGRYLSLFPGSFDKATALGVLAGTSALKGNSIYFLEPIKTLVVRSLLDVESNSDRYRYHRLIKSFFEGHVKSSELRKFWIAFQIYFSNKLNNLMNEFVSHPSKALVKLNTEQHNILYFVSSLYHVPLQDQLPHYVTMMSSFIKLFNSGYLHVRFRKGELIERTNIILDNLETYIMSNRLSSIFPIFFHIYINLILAVGSLHVHDRELSLKEYLKRIQIVEEVKHLPGTTDEYSHFYYNILKFKDILDEETVKFYHSRLLDQAKNSKLDCTLSKSFTTCGYIHIASSYYFLSDYEKSAEFFERALNNEIFSIFDKVLYHDLLLKSYIKLRNISKKIEVENRLLGLFSSLLDQSSPQVLVHLNCYKQYLSILETLGELKKAIAIHEKIVESMEELGQSEAYRENVPELYIITKLLLELKEYERVVKFANHALVHVKPESSIHNYLRFCLWKGQALYSMGNLTDANKLFQNLIIFLVEKNLTSYSQVYKDVCYYLFQMGHYSHFFECYFDDIMEYLKIGTYVAIYIVFKVEYDPIPEVYSPPEVVQPIEKYPPIIKLSKKSSLSVGQTKDMTRSGKTPLFPFSSTPVDSSEHFKSACNMIMKYNLVRVFFNLSSISARLWIVYFLYVVVKFSMKKTFYFTLRIFKLIYFILLCTLVVYYSYVK